MFGSGLSRISDESQAAAGVPLCFRGQLLSRFGWEGFDMEVSNESSGYFYNSFSIESECGVPFIVDVESLVLVTEYRTRAVLVRHLG